MDDPCALGGCEERCCVGEVVEYKIRQDSDEDGSYTFKDEDPSPSLQSSNTIHLRYRKGQKPGECTRNRRRAEEKRLSELSLVSAVPHGDIVRYSREETSFRDAEEDASDEEAVVVLDDAHERHYYAPCHHDSWEPDRRAEFLQHEVAGHFECAIREEEHRETPVVFWSGEMQRFSQTFDLRVADVPSV